MATLTNCKACGKPVSRKLKACMHCGEPVRSSLPMLLFKAFIISAAILGGFNYCFMKFNEIALEFEQADAIPWDERNYESTAYRMCADRVRQNLKSPSTAEFESVWDGRYDNVVQAGQRYYFESYVDSENGFGATLRTHFQCSVSQVSEGSWRINKLEFSE